MSNQIPQLLPDVTLTLDDPSDLLPPLRKLPPRSPTSELSDRKMPAVAKPIISHITEFPLELQVNILTYLRAYDLTTVHQTCQFYHDPNLVHSIVVHAAERVYPLELTQGFDEQPVSTDIVTTTPPASGNAVGKKGKKKGPPSRAIAVTGSPAAATAVATANSPFFTFEHLRNMELLVVARVLSRPEPMNCPDDDGEEQPPGGYYVSKSWCKTALKWLEWQQERQQQFAQEAQQKAAVAAAAASGNAGKKNKKVHNSNKLSKKQQRLRQRKYSDAMSLPPWPNVNSDIVCCHDQLQLCSSRKSARSRRKVLDKQAWKCLKKLYPESVSLEAKQGECLQCMLQTESTKRDEQQREEQLKEERRAPLSQPVLRRFYTRTRGVPVHSLVTVDDDNKDDAKPRAVATLSSPISSKPKSAVASGACPLVPGLYHAIPRAWCHAWRKYIKTGEGGALLPPDASSLLCGCHRLPLPPPHLESYVYGESPQLWLSKKQQQEDELLLLEESNNNANNNVASAAVTRRSVVGLSAQPSDVLLASMAELGLSPAELAQQQRAMMSLESQQQRQQQQRELQQEEQEGRRSSSSGTMGEQLDRENYCCVEILDHEELVALEKLWPQGPGAFRLSFKVSAPTSQKHETTNARQGGGKVAFSTQPCRECDNSGMANLCKIPKNSKAHLRATHQAKVQTYKKNKASGNGNGGGSKPGVQLEY